MSTLSPPDLLLRWTQEDLTVEQATGHLVQIINAYHQQFQELRQRLNALEQQVAAQANPAVKPAPKRK